MAPHEVAELRTCLELLVRQIGERSIDLKDVPDLLCGIDKQIYERAKKALRTSP